MAEFIIRWRGSWMDEWDAAKVATLTGKTLAKYIRRPQKGDVIRVWPDGEGAWRVKGNPDFKVVKVPGMAVDEEYMSSLQYQDGIDPRGLPRYAVLKKYKWHLDVSSLPQAILNALESSHVVTISAPQFGAVVKAKT